MKKSEILFRKLRRRGDKFTDAEEACLTGQYCFLEDMIAHGMHTGILVDAFLKNDRTRINLLLEIRLGAKVLYDYIVTVSQVYEFNNLELACILCNRPLAVRMAKSGKYEITNFANKFLKGGDVITLLKREANKVENGMEDEIYL